jgi:uncharacterized protein YecE (DUF72 family)
MNRLLVGTASWTDKTLIQSGRFYPREARTSEDRLRYYATIFPLTEIDSSYYAIPNSSSAQLWIERTPMDFVFDVKAFRLFTGHQTDLKILPKEIRGALGKLGKSKIYYKDVPAEVTDELWNQFREPLQVLRAAGKLGAVLFQYPPWFFPSRESYAHILLCKEKLAGIPIAVEFRSQSWFKDERRNRVLAFLREHELVHVVVDEPQGFSSSIPPVWEVSSASLAIVRFHGRNRDTWMRKGLASAAERFNYLYSEEELQELAANVESLSGRAAHTHALFNNCYEDKGQRNAIDFMRLLSPS